MASGSFNLVAVGIYGAALLGVAGVGIAYVAQPNETETIVVNSKERGNSDRPDLIYTARATYKVDDSWTRMQFNSADIYGMMRANCSYKISHYGFRSGFLSQFPNITSAEHVPTAACPTNGGMPNRAPRR